jgi:hypothetical protein
MSLRLYRSLAVLVLALALPATTQAQFGSLIKKAKALRTNVDSAKAVVDTSRTVVTATKSAAADVMTGTTGPATPPDSSGGAAGAAGAGGTGKSAGGARHGGAKAGADVSAGSAGSAAAGGTAAPAPKRASGTAAAGARTKASVTNSSAATNPTRSATPKPAAVTPAAPAAAPAAASAPATRGAPSTRAAPARSGGAQMTEAEYGQFSRGFAAEQATLKTTPGDMAGALKAGVAASGLNNNDYLMVRQEAMMYAQFARANKTDQAASLFSAQDLAVLNAHKSEIIQRMAP